MHMQSRVPLHRTTHWHITDGSSRPLLPVCGPTQHGSPAVAGACSLYAVQHSMVQPDRSSACLLTSLSGSTRYR